VLVFSCTAGLLAGTAIGYWRFDDSPGWAVMLGIAIAAVLTLMTWRELGTPEAIERGVAGRNLGRAIAHLGLPFVALLVAFFAGLAAGSERVFVGVFAAGLAIGFAIRFTVWR
jgi:hypothetical protein